jgi:hypothetical protein
MTRAEARRVACLIAATQIDNYLSTGSLVELTDIAGEDATALVEDEMTKLADRLDERGRRQGYGGVTTLQNSLHIAGVRGFAATQEMSDD